MSNFLLQKSFKLFQDSSQTKKAKKSTLQKLKKKRNCVTVKKIKEKELEDNILKNLEKIIKLNKKDFINVPKEVLERHIGSKDDDNSEIKADQPTVFTDKDFEEFEKEYLES